MTQIKRAELRPLTSLRFFAALLVFITHCFWAWGPHRQSSYGYIGVGFFFLLSGFILSYTYNSLAEGLTWQSLRQFFLARFARIYPIYTLALVAFILVEWRSWIFDHQVQNVLVFVSQLLLIQSWVPSPIYYYGANEVAWSISDETFFYIAFPFGLYAVARALKACPTSAYLALAAGVWGVYVGCIHWRILDLSTYTLYICPPIRFVDFFVGLLIGMAFTRIAPECRSVSRTAATIAEVLAVALCLIVTCSVTALPLEYQYAAAAMPILGATILVFAFQAGAISQWLSNSRLMYLGEVSYAFYIIHFMIIQRLQAIPDVGNSHDVRVRLGLVIGSFVVSLWISHMMHQEIEKPLRMRILGVSRLSEAVPAATVISE